MKYSVRTHNPKFMNTFRLGLNPAAFSGEVISSLTQATMYTYELAPMATLIELELLSKMSSMVGKDFEGGSGVFTSGGSMGNLLGILCAR